MKIVSSDSAERDLAAPAVPRAVASPMKVLVTDVMRHRGQFCVAGWGVERHATIRLRPLPERPWPPGLVAEHSIAGGAVIACEGRPGNPEVDPEDVLFSPGSLRLVEPAPAPWKSALSLPPAPSRVSEAFAGTVRARRVARGFIHGAHVPAGAVARSLAGVVVDALRLRFLEGPAGHGLLARVHDGVFGYILPVTCHALLSLHEAAGLDAVNAVASTHRPIHLRLALARPVPRAPDRRAVMVSMLYV